MQKLLASFAIFAAFAAVSSVWSQTTAFGVSNSPGSVNYPGQTNVYLINGASYGYDGSVMTYLNFGLGYVNETTGEGISVGFMIPFTSGTGSINEQTYSFENQDVMARFNVPPPSMDVFSYKFASNGGTGLEWYHDSAVVSATFTVHELTMVDYGLQKFAVTFDMFEGPILGGPIEDKGFALYNSNYVVTDFSLPVTSPVPEPSTNAAIAGIIGLGAALLHAKRKRASLAP